MKYDLRCHSHNGSLLRLKFTRPSSLNLDGNGHRVVDIDGDSFFLVEGAIDVTFFNMTFEHFHATDTGDEVSRCSPIFLKRDALEDFCAWDENGKP